MANNYPVNPTVPLGWELPDGFGGLSVEDLSFLNTILRSLYHTHSVPAEAAKHPSARFTYVADSGNDIGNGYVMAWDGVTVLGEDYVAGDWWSSGDPTKMKAPERGLYLLEHSGAWLSSSTPSTYWIHFTATGVSADHGGQHIDRPSAILGGNKYRINHSRLIPLAKGQHALLQWHHTNDGGLGDIPDTNYVTMTKVGPYN